jgi:hypothetical protein
MWLWFLTGGIYFNEHKKNAKNTKNRGSKKDIY